MVETNLLPQARSALRIQRLRLILGLCLLEILAPVLVILNYFGISMLQLVNLNQLFIFASIVLLSSSFRIRRLNLMAIMLIMLIISFAKMFMLTGIVNFNVTSSAVFPYFYSLVMPFLVINAIMNLKVADIGIVVDDLNWFAKRYLFLIGPVILAYSALYFSGRIRYFGLGTNMHYIAPFFFSRAFSVLGLALLILITGKRSVLINFLAQYGIYLFGLSKRAPIKVLLLVVISSVAILFSQDILSVLLRRFIFMYENFKAADFSRGILGLANSYEAIALFGGRLEEVVGITQYFADHPGQIWLGTPPGAVYAQEIARHDTEHFKSYAHLTWVGYAFRFGIIPTAILIVYLLYNAIRYADPRNPLWIVFVGALTSATFGGNMYYSPVGWTMIAIFMRFGPEISRSMKQGGWHELSAKRQRTRH